MTTAQIFVGIALLVTLIIVDAWFTVHTDEFTLIRWLSEFPKIFTQKDEKDD